MQSANKSAFTENKKVHICVIGLGYVGLPLAMEFSKFFKVTGFDIDASRIDELINGVDRTREVSLENFYASKTISFTHNEPDISSANIYVVTVPTPISIFNEPDLKPLIDATKLVGRNLKKNDLVIYESTVYPGATEIECIPLLEEISGLQVNSHFHVGYSPERINPGDKVNTLIKIRKITSGSNEFAADVVDSLYSKIITAGTYLAPSITIAEAAKILENTQRDVNIALMNEFSEICARLSIDTLDVINAASTKWNFSRFTPGLVGGHCIGVDPYYLIHRSKEIGYFPTIIHSARVINEDMPKKISENLISRLSKFKSLDNCRALVVGVSFKENCPDLRNSKVPELVNRLKESGVNIDVFDPCVDPLELYESFNLNIIHELNKSTYDCVVIAVPHAEIIAKGAQFWLDLLNETNLMCDLKSAFPKKYSDYRL